jgi:hypothetical protein
MAEYIAEGVRIGGHETEVKNISEIRIEKNSAGFQGMPSRPDQLLCRRAVVRNASPALFALSTLNICCTSSREMAENEFILAAGDLSLTRQKSPFITFATGSRYD